MAAIHMTVMLCDCKFDTTNSFNKEEKKLSN